MDIIGHTNAEYLSWSNTSRSHAIWEACYVTHRRRNQHTEVTLSSIILHACFHNFQKEILQNESLQPSDSQATLLTKRREWKGVKMSGCNSKILCYTPSQEAGTPTDHGDLLASLQNAFPSSIQWMENFHVLLKGDVERNTYQNTICNIGS